MKITIVLDTDKETVEDLKRLQKGIYSIKITFKDENSIIQKIIK